jgi:hypothetical protein
MVIKQKYTEPTITLGQSLSALERTGLGLFMTQSVLSWVPERPYWGFWVALGLDGLGDGGDHPIINNIEASC